MGGGWKNPRDRYEPESLLLTGTTVTRFKAVPLPRLQQMDAGQARTKPVSLESGSLESSSLEFGSLEFGSNE